MKRNRIILITAIMTFAMAGTSSAQVLINEVMSSNYGTLCDETGHYEDWIELYNAGTAPVNLAGYGLSNKASKLYKFTFPSYTLAVNDHVLIFATDSNITNIGAHWESPVKAGDTWRYRANTTAWNDTNWRNLSFNETVWSSGIGGFGFGDGDDATTIPVCASVFIRKTFTITDTSKIMDAVFNIDYDDGFVAFLNGVEIARTNIELPGTRPAWNKVVYSSHEAQMYQGMAPDSFHLSESFIKSIIKNGTNVLAVQVHNRSATESDMSCIPFLSLRIKDATVMFPPTPPWFVSSLHPVNYFHAAFKISQAGETVYLTNPAGSIVDQIAVPYLELDNSYGRNTDGQNLWKYFGTSTPDATNSSVTGYSAYATIPLFSLQAGFYTGTQTLSITTSYPGGVVRYTTNGNAPTITSPVYTSPISITKTTSVRARVFSATSLPSATITNSYFINLNCKLPVYCLTLDSADLWDYNKGIFVKGPNASPNAPYFGANYWQDWEKFASVEFFDKQKNRAFKFNTGLCVTGGWSRRYDQKSLEIKLGDKYGLSKLQYEMIPDKKWIGKWSDFLLHTTGNDRGIAHMRDPVMERLMKGSNTDYMAYEPALIYINGVQWGVYYTKENDDHHFVEENYGYDKTEIDLLKESYFFPDIEVKQGSDTAFRTMHTYAMNTSPTSSSFYSNMDSMIDIKNQVDYFAAECYYPNDDWMGGSNNNLKLWRPKKAGGRFRYILYDLDFGFGISGTVSTDILSIALNPDPHNYNSDIFKRLLLNTKYKNYFINRYADLINTIWKQENVVSVVNSFRDSIRYDMHFQYDKWGGDTNLWNNNIASMLTFSNGRPAYARNQIQNDLGMAGQVTLTIQASPAGSGRIQISTITPQTLPWSGVYFNGNPVTLTAIPNPGYTFLHWNSNVVITTSDTNLAVTRNFTANDVITAYFTGSPVTPQFTISEINYNSDSAHNAGDWFEIHNLTSSRLDISGWKVKDDNDHHEFVFPVTTTIAANGYLVVSVDTQKFHNQHPTVANVIGETGFNFSDGGDQIRLYKYNDSLFLSLEYDDEAPWPLEADAGGYTLELRDSLGNLSDGNNWFAGCPGGSPGRAYSAPVAAITTSASPTMCVGDTLVLTATAANGNQYQWLRNNIYINGAIAQTFQPVQSDTYRVAVTNNGCTSVSDSTVVIINPVSINPVITSASRCGAGSVTLSATAADPVKWYDAQSNLVGTGNSFTTPSLSATTIYYAKAGTTCPSALVPDSAIINAIPSSPVTTNNNICGHGVMTLTAASNDVIRWYNAPNGTLLATSDSLTTPDISLSTTYYAQSGELCKSGFIPAIATVNPVSALPVSNSSSRCDEGSVTFNATSQDTIRWYDSLNGNLLNTGNTFQTPVLSSTTIYYLRAGTLCPSAYVNVQAIISTSTPDPVAPGQSRCGAGTVTLTAAATDTVRWYDSPNGNLLFTGNTFVTPTLNLSTTYFVVAGLQCASDEVAVEATVNTISADPVVSDASRCGDGILQLAAQSNEIVQWFDSPNGTVLFSGNNFTTPSISQTTTYFAVASGICPSNAMPVQAIVNSFPADPVASDISRCGAGSVNLTASATDTIRWYDAQGGNMVYEGAFFNTPAINQSTTYYVRAEGICPGNYIPVQAIINSIPSDPTVADQSRCGTGSLMLNAIGIDTIRWYNSPNGNLLGVGSSFTTPVLNQSTTYAVRTESVCPGNYVTVNAFIKPNPVDPTVTPGSTCGPGTVVLIAMSSDTVYWFDAPHGNMVGSGLTYQTPYLNATTTYFAKSVNGCEGNFVPVSAHVFSAPDLFIGNDTIIESGSAVILDAGPGFVTYLWNTGETSQTTSVSSTGNFWVTVTDVHGCTATDSIQVMVSVNVQPYVLSEGVLIYPNPTHSNLSISFLNEDNEDIFLRLIDGAGKLIWSDFSIKEKRVIRNVDLTQFARGVYVLQIASSKTKREFKVILK